MRTAKADLLRVVLVESDGVASVVPDLHNRLPGRGASVPPALECLDLAERRRAFPRALRRPGPVDTGPLRRWLVEQV